MSVWIEVVCDECAGTSWGGHHPGTTPARVRKAAYNDGWRLRPKTKNTPAGDLCPCCAGTHRLNQMGFCTTCLSRNTTPKIASDTPPFIGGNA